MSWNCLNSLEKLDVMYYSGSFRTFILVGELENQIDIFEAELEGLIVKKRKQGPQDWFIWKHPLFDTRLI
ncbi:unnamed protein product [Cuscuta campestris]|uniref:Uncharacterized protein n=1 Tax=Cuscuta campestris TaxID=132261 RepID=A0A484N535_9ASTE|nr:unnamed protein product [Cuscuta campestris]